LLAYGGYPEIRAPEIHSNGVRGHAQKIITDRPCLARPP
jgi:hypothetical protein